MVTSINVSFYHQYYNALVTKWQFYIRDFSCYPCLKLSSRWDESEGAWCKHRSKRESRADLTPLLDQNMSQGQT
jgi:hypothetical protein